MPKVSVFVPYYNDERFLTACIDSVLQQTFGDFELILLNHAATDASPRLARSYSDARIKHIDLPHNHGAGGGLLMEAFLNVATGEYAKLFCADDILLPDCLATLVEASQQHPEVTAFFSRMQTIDAHGQPSKRQVSFNSGLNERELLKRFVYLENHLPYPASFVKLCELRTLTLDTTSIMTFDMSLWLQLLLKQAHFQAIDAPLVQYRVHEQQMSSPCKLDAVCEQRLYYEHTTFIDLFYRIESVALMKALFTTSFNQSILEQLTDDDVALIPFIISHFYLHSGQLNLRTAAYLKLQTFFNDATLRQTLHERLGFSVADFRQLYSTLNASHLRRSERLFLTPSKALTLGQLCQLAGRQLTQWLKQQTYRRLCKRLE
ncbi:MAG: glycosyltransferase family 2 protein [Vampirovibrionales bacterium]